MGKATESSLRRKDADKWSTILPTVKLQAIEGHFQVLAGDFVRYCEHLWLKHLRLTLFLDVYTEQSDK